MKITRNFFLLIFLSLWGFSALAQPYTDLLHVRTNLYAKAPYLDDPQASVSQTEQYASLFLPYVMKNGDVLFTGLDWIQQEFRYHGDTSYTRYLNSHMVPLGFIHGWKNKAWKTTFLLTPKLAKGLNNNIVSDFQLGGVVLMTWQQSKRLKYKFGVYYNREFYGNSFLPLLGIDWMIDENTYLFGVLPGSLNLEYHLARRFYTGLAYKNITATYRLNHGTEEDYVREGHNFLGDNHLSLFLHFYPHKNLVVYAAAGMTLFRRFQLFDTNHNELDYSPEAQKAFQYSQDRGFFQFGAAFRIRMDKAYRE